MTLVQRSRFSVFLKNLTGFRGAFGMSLDAGITPSFDFSRPEALLDDEVSFWFARGNQAAVAAQFSYTQITCPNPNTRAVIDRVIIKSQATGTVRFGLAPVVAAGGVAVTNRNNFLNNRGPGWTLASASLGAVLVNSTTQAADPFAGVPPAAFAEVDMTIGAAAQVFDDQFLMTPGFAFVLSPGAVNLALAVNVFGRYLADQT